MRSSWALLFLCAAPLAAANLVVNGDFETPNIGNVLFVTINQGDPTLTGWTVDAPSPGEGIDLISNRTGCAACANTGQQAVDMSGSPGPGFIYQDMATTPGASYLLTFWLSSNGGPFLNGLTVAWNGTNIDTVTSPPQGTWLPFQYNVTATGASTRLEFFSNVPGNSGPFLDTVSVVSTAPEPAPGVLILLSAAALPLLRRRRTD
jgi:choice-of-anchor C domain-containing protein